MRDLNKTLFFRTQFDVSSEDENVDILWSIVLKIRKWMVYKWEKQDVQIPYENYLWSKFKYGSQIISDDKSTVFFESSLFADEKFSSSEEFDLNKVTEYEWACKIKETIERDFCAQREWVSEISYTQEEPGKGTVAIIVSYSDRAGFIGPVQDTPSFSIPGIVTRIINDPKLKCSVNNTPINMEPLEVTFDNIVLFWKMVSNPQRGIPVIYISPHFNEKSEVVNLVDPIELNRVLGPNAIVAYSCDASINKEMHRIVQNDDLRTTGGMVRIYTYNPRFHDPKDTYRHRYFRPDEIKYLGSETIINYLRKAFCQDVHFYDNFLRKKDVDSHIRHAILLKKARERRLAHVEEAVEQSLESLEDAYKELQMYKEEADVYAEEVDELSIENDELKSKLFNANEQIKGLQIALSSSGNTGQEVQLDNWPMPYETLVSLFLTAFPARIVLTDAAWKTLENCTTSPEVVWNALYDLAEIAWPLYKDGSKDIEKEFTDSSYFELAKTEGKMTKGDSSLSADYMDTYNGLSYNCMTHIVHGSKESDERFIRIYFCYSRIEEKIIVSHIGKHKKNRTSRNF